MTKIILLSIITTAALLASSPTPQSFQAKQAKCLGFLTEVSICVEKSTNKNELKVCKKMIHDKMKANEMNRERAGRKCNGGKCGQGKCGS